MTKREWTMKEKTIVALAFVAVALFFGLTTGARYPAIVTWNATYYPQDYDEHGEYRESTRCWGIPVIYWSCATAMVPLDADSDSG